MGSNCPTSSSPVPLLPRLSPVRSPRPLKMIVLHPQSPLSPLYLSCPHRPLSAVPTPEDEPYTVSKMAGLSDPTWRPEWSLNPQGHVRLTGDSLIRKLKLKDWTRINNEWLKNWLSHLSPSSSFFSEPTRLCITSPLSILELPLSWTACLSPGRDSPLSQSCFEPILL